MPRPKPPYADEPLPRSASISRKLRVAGACLKARRPELAIRDFSDLLSRALSDYLERHHPGLLAEVAEALKKETAPPELMVAEAAATYPEQPDLAAQITVAAATLKPALEQARAGILRAEAKRRSRIPQSKASPRP